MTFGLVTGGFPLGLSELSSETFVTPPFTFDGINKLIIVDYGVTEFTVVQLWSRWIDWAAYNDNSKYLPALRYVGGDSISPTQNLGVTYFLLNGWRIRPYEGNHSLTVTGNIYTEPAGFSIFVPTLGGFNVNTEIKVSNLVDSAISQLEELEQLSYEGKVSINQLTGIAGTTYPIGNRANPSNNLTNASSIAESRNIKTLLVSGIYTTAIGEVISGKALTGFNLNNDRIVTQVGTALIGCDFVKLWVSGSGVLGGTYTESFLEDIPSLLGGAKDCGFLGSFSFLNAPPYAFQAFDCHTTRSTDSKVTLNMVSGVNVLFHRCSGHWKLSGMTSGNHVFNMSGAHVEIDNTCTGGTVTIRGDSKVTNNGINVTVIDETTGGASSPIGLQVNEIATIHGLIQGSPLVVTPTSRTAGSISQSLTGDGVTSQTATRL
jgi:hypothetical protein